jgi:spore coat protein U-like protein
MKTLNRPMKRFLINALAVISVASTCLLGSPAQAGSDTKDFKVKAHVDAQCLIDAVDIDFGAYDVLAGTGKQTTGSVSVRCTKGATVSIALNDGVNGTRKMSNGATTLNYELYSDTDRSVRWGSGGSAVNPYAPSATATSTASTAVTVYADLPGGQTNATPGAYEDTITATVNF